MAKFGLFYRASVTINSVDLSPFVRSVGFRQASQPIDLAAMGDLYANRKQGLKGAEAVISLWQSFYTAEVHETLKGLYNNGTEFTIEIVAEPTPTAVNPSFSFTGFLPAYNPIDGAHGDGLSTDITVELTGGGTTGVTEATS